MGPGVAPVSVLPVPAILGSVVGGPDRDSIEFVTACTGTWAPSVHVPASKEVEVKSYIRGRDL